MKLEVHQVLHELANDLMFTILKISALLYKEVDVERGSLFRCGLSIHLTHPSGVKCVLTAARFKSGQWKGEVVLSLRKQCSIDPSHKSHNASHKYPIMHHFVTEMCTHVHISVTKCCIVGYGTDAFWDLWNGSIGSNCCNGRPWLWLTGPNWLSHLCHHDNLIGIVCGFTICAGWL